MKPFAWSYSRLKNFETCPRRHFEVDIAKNFKDEEGDNLLYGNMVHDVLAKYISKATPIPEIHKPDLQKWGDYGRRLAEMGMDVKVEQKLAITNEFGPCEYFARSAWFRGVADVLAIKGPVAIVLDWKTGKILEDSQQLALSAACVFAHYTDVQKVRTQFVWIKDDCNTTVDFARADMTSVWGSLWPRIQALANAHETGTYPAKPSGLCRKFCPVTTCAHHGQGR